MRKIKELIIHCAATPANMDIGVAEIATWHKDEGFKLIGYHYVIRRSGLVEVGREEVTVGAHCSGRNAQSIGICLVGGITPKGKKPENNFTQEQFVALEELLRGLIIKYPEARIYPHNAFANKACPSFDVKEYLEIVGLSDFVGKKK